MLNYEFPPLGGGASPVSYEIAKGYVKLGHKVDVVTMGFKGLPNFEIKDGIKIYRVKCLRSKKEICYPHEMLTYIISAKLFLKNHLKNNKYDINHTHFIIPTGIVSLWAKKFFGLPYIITSHGSDVLGYNKRFNKLYPLLKGIWKKIIKEAKVVVTPSKFLEDKIKELTLNGKIIIIPNGIDITKFKPLKKKNRILVVSRLFVNKGVQDILDALNDDKLKQILRKKKWEIDIVGDGPYKQFLENKVKENGLNDLVKFQGWVDNSSKKMKLLYGQSKIFISASYFESFGLNILEAISAGCDLIVSDLNSHKSIINKRKNYFRKGNISELRKTLLNKLKYPEQNDKRNLDLYKWDTIILEYFKVLK